MRQHLRHLNLRPDAEMASTQIAAKTQEMDRNKQVISGELQKMATNEAALSVRALVSVLLPSR
jgi:hypothetical protein